MILLRSRLALIAAVAALVALPGCATDDNIERDAEDAGQSIERGAGEAGREVEKGVKDVDGR